MLTIELAQVVVASSYKTTTQAPRLCFSQHFLLFVSPFFLLFLWQNSFISLQILYKKRYVVAAAFWYTLFVIYVVYLTKWETTTTKNPISYFIGGWQNKNQQSCIRLDKTKTKNLIPINASAFNPLVRCLIGLYWSASLSILFALKQLHKFMLPLTYYKYV